MKVKIISVYLDLPNCLFLQRVKFHDSKRAVFRVFGLIDGSLIERQFNDITIARQVYECAKIGYYA